MHMSRSVFPCGDSMVAIIDDREDVWGRCPNLLHVKPYMFFTGTADINAPPPLHHHHVRPRPPRMQHQHIRGGRVGKGSHPRQAPPPPHHVHSTMKRMRIDGNQIHEDGRPTQDIANEPTPQQHEVRPEMMDSDSASPSNNRDASQVVTTTEQLEVKVPSAEQARVEGVCVSSTSGAVTVPFQPPASQCV